MLRLEVSHEYHENTSHTTGVINNILLSKLGNLLNTPEEVNKYIKVHQVGDMRWQTSITAFVLPHEDVVELHNRLIALRGFASFELHEHIEGIVKLLSIKP